MKDCTPDYLEHRIKIHEKACAMGAIATCSDLIEFEQPTRNHAAVMRRAVDAGSNQHMIDHYDLLDWHAALFPYGGCWRTSGVYVAGSDYIPPSSYALPRLMLEFSRDLEWWLTKSTEDPFIILAHLHIELTKIHPFSDGNGRISRLLLNYCAAFLGLAPIRLEPENRDYYLDLLQSENETGLALLFYESAIY